MASSSYQFDLITKRYREQLNTLPPPHTQECKTYADVLKLEALHQHQEESKKKIEVAYRKDLMTILLAAPLSQSSVLTSDESKSPKSTREDELKNIVEILKANTSQDELFQLALFHKRQSDLNAELLIYKSILEKKSRLNSNVIYSLIDSIKSSKNPIALEQYNKLIDQWFNNCFINSNSKQQLDFMQAVLDGVQQNTNHFLAGFVNKIKNVFPYIFLENRLVFCKKLLSIEQRRKGFFYKIKSYVQAEQDWKNEINKCNMLKMAYANIHKTYISLPKSSSFIPSRFELIMQYNKEAVTHIDEHEIVSNVNKYALIAPLERHLGLGKLSIIIYPENLSPLQVKVDITDENFFATLYLIRISSKIYKNFNYQGAESLTNFLNEYQVDFMESIFNSRVDSKDNLFIHALCSIMFSIERIMMIYDKNWLEKRGISLSQLEENELIPLMLRCKTLAIDLLTFRPNLHETYRRFLTAIVASGKKISHSCNQSRIAEIYKGSLDKKNRLYKLPVDTLRHINLFLSGELRVSTTPVSESPSLKI